MLYSNAVELGLVEMGDVEIMFLDAGKVMSHSFAENGFQSGVAWKQP